MQQIRMVLQVDEPEDADEASESGLTQEAYNRLYDVVADAGFSWVSGPVPFPRPKSTSEPTPEGV